MERGIRIRRQRWSRSEAAEAVILAGGLGTRLSEETAVRPKPMVEIGARPIIWHTMKAVLGAWH
jgi:choline kinase